MKLMESINTLSNSKNYLLNSQGKCEISAVESAFMNEKCVQCSDIDNGGVKNC